MVGEKLISDGQTQVSLCCKHHHRRQPPPPHAEQAALIGSVALLLLFLFFPTVSHTGERVFEMQGCMVLTLP